MIVLLNHHGPWFVLVDLVLSYPGLLAIAAWPTSALLLWRSGPYLEANELRELLRF